MLERSALPTLFLTAERAPDGAVAADVERFRSYTLLDQFAAALPSLFLVLNQQRQIVFANQALIELLGLANMDEVVGLRVGEALDCMHGNEPPHGCGTTEFCHTCGAAKVMAASLRGRPDEQECRILRKDGSALDLRVRGRPLDWDGSRYLVFAINDISHEQRRLALERIFFHDILNTAGGMLGIAELLRDGTADDVAEFKDKVALLAGSLVDEILAQQTLMAAERGELVPAFQVLDALMVLRDVRDTYGNHEVSLGRAIVIAPQAESAWFVSDATLVRRVVGNMLKNALEACRPGQAATLCCRVIRDGVEFSVHNPGYIQRDIQLQMFQRSFSSKGPGRGLGAYSMKLLSERYLNGTVTFTTDPEQGTVFYARYPFSPERIRFSNGARRSDCAGSLPSGSISAIE